MDGPDSKSIARRFRRVARKFADRDFLHAEIRGRLLERLDLVNLTPALLLDLGAGPGRGATALACRFPQARVVALDLVPEMLAAEAPAGWAAVCGDAARLPLAEASIDIVFSNLLLHWCTVPEAVLSEVRRVLRYPGHFSFTTFGPDTFRELRSAWSAADRFSHVPDFSDMHNLGDALVRAGFAEPVMDTETLTITYADVQTLTADLRAAGATNLTARRNRSLTGRAAWARMTAAYDQARNAAGRLPVTLEVIYGHAWSAQAAAEREIAVPIARLRRLRSR